LVNTEQNPADTMYIPNSQTTQKNLLVLTRKQLLQTTFRQKVHNMQHRGIKKQQMSLEAVIF